MPVYIRKGPGVGIPEPSDNGKGDDEDDETFLRDPDQLHDQLPQPFRMIDKVLGRLIDRAWDTISERETIRIAEQSKKKIPVLKLTGDVKLPTRTNCLACSENGRYIFMGHSQGLSVTSSSSLICVSAWLEDRVEITSLHITCLGEMAYLVGAVDDMGVARLFAFHAESIYLVKVINETEDINQRNVCMKFELSKGGDFGAASMSCGGAHWLEIYRFPKESWLKELETMQASSQKQTQHPSGVGDVKLSPITVFMKIKPPKAHTGTTLKSPFEVLQKTEDGTVIGSGQNHLISSHQWEDQDAVFKSRYRRYFVKNPCKTAQAEERPSHCTSHFLLPGGMFPFLGGMKPQPGVPVAVCMWWSGSHNLLQYLLCKSPKDKPDTESKPDVLWPNAHEILCSAVSGCTRYVAVGLATELVTLWDRHLGLPLSVLQVLADSALSRLVLLDYWPGPGPAAEAPLPCQGPCQAHIHLLLTCKSGACLVLTSGGGAGSHATQMRERPSDPGSFPTVVASVPFLTGLALLIERNGKMLLQDAVNRRILCRLSLPDTHLLATPWEPVFSLDPVQQTLFIRGDQHPKETLESGDTQSLLFLFRFNELDIIEPYRHALRGSLKGQPGTGVSDLEEACNLYFQQRVLSLDERNRAMTQTWSQLQQHAVAVLHNQHEHHTHTKTTPQRS